MKPESTVNVLQVWPKGTSYAYMGDPHGPADQKLLKIQNYQGKKNRWRKGTNEEWRMIRIELMAEIYVDRDILACQSALVDDLIREQHEGFETEDLENMYVDPSDWTLGTCIRYMDEHGIDFDPSDLDEGTAQQLIRDGAETAEPYEWHLVTSWLCDQLRSIGEVVINNGYGCYWGRQCSGQALIMDGTLQAIATKFEDNR